MNLKIFIFLILIFILRFSHAETPTHDVASLIDKGDYTAASVEVSANNDENFPKKYWSGRIQYGFKKYAAAAELFENSSNTDENGKNILLWWARALRNSGALNKALTVYEMAYKEDTKNQMLIGEYASVKALTGDYAAANDLFSLITNQDIINKAERWRELLKPLVNSIKLEPLKLHCIDGMLICSNDEKEIVNLEKIAIRSKNDVEKTMGIQLPSFRLLVFASRESFLKYSDTVHNKNRAVSSPSFTLPGVIAIWNPSNWDTPPQNDTEVPGIIRHEMVHLAISAITHGENIPLWLNEGLACKYGGGIEVKAPDNITDKSFSEINTLLNSNEEKEQLTAYYLALEKVNVITREMTIDDVHAMLILLADGENIETVIKEITGKDLKVLFPLQK